MLWFLRIKNTVSKIMFSYVSARLDNRNLKFFKKNSIVAQLISEWAYLMRGSQNGLTFWIWTNGPRDIYILVFWKRRFLWTRVRVELNSYLEWHQKPKFLSFFVVLWRFKINQFTQDTGVLTIRFWSIGPKRLKKP